MIRSLNKHLKKPFAGTSRVSKLINRFVKNDDGAVVVEFAMMLPVFTALFLGYAAFAKSGHVSARVGKVAGTVSDIVSQSDQLSAAEIDGALLAGNAIAGVQDGGAMQIAVIGVEILANGTTSVSWARGINGAPVPAKNSSYDLPSSLLSQAGFVVVSTTRYDYYPAVGGALIGSVPYRYNHYFVPRNAAQMECSDCP